MTAPSASAAEKVESAHSPALLAQSQYYARRAAEYDRIYEKPERQAELQNLKNAVEHFFAGQSILEAACGTGYWTQFAAKNARSIHATDINDEVLAIARNRDYASAKPVFERRDAFDLADAPGPFGAGMACFWWSHVLLHDLPRFLRGFCQALAPGAPMLFMDNRYAEGSSTPISRRDSRGNTWQQRTLADGSTHEVLKNFPSREALLTALSPFAKEITVQEMHYYWLLTCRTRLH